MKEEHEVVCFNEKFDIKEAQLTIMHVYISTISKFYLAQEDDENDGIELDYEIVAKKGELITGTFTQIILNLRDNKYKSEPEAVDDFFQILKELKIISHLQKDGEEFD